jgi:hypothetical protein
MELPLSLEIRDTIALITAVLVAELELGFRSPRLAFYIS